MSAPMSCSMTSIFAPRARTEGLFGDVAVVIFLLVQAMDGVLTYVGVHVWGPAIEANPIVRSAVSLAGVGAGLAGAKLVAVAFGIMLHLRGVHHVIAILTAFYIAAAILPWTLLLLTL